MFHIKVEDESTDSSVSLSYKSFDDLSDAIGLLHAALRVSRDFGVFMDSCKRAAIKQGAEIVEGSS